MFFSKKLKKFENIKHCFFSRKNGFSTGRYTSLNCGLGSGDKKENVLKNLSLVSQKIGCKDELLITLNQTHSNKVVYFENKNFKYKADLYYRLKRLLDYKEMGHLFKVLFAQKKNTKFSLGFL